MVNRHLIAIFVSAALSGVAIADNCKHGLYYCGSSLLKKGNYYEDIYNSLVNAGQSTADNHVQQSLFYCKGDDDVPFTAYCQAGCQDNGSGKSDNCH